MLTPRRRRGGQAAARLPGFIGRDCGELGRHRVGFIGRHVDPDQRGEGDAEIGLARRAVDQRGCGDHLSARLADRLDRLARGKTRGDHILDHQHLRAGIEPKAAAQLEHALRPLEEHRRLAQRAAHFVADDHAAHRRRDDDVDPVANLARKLGGEGPGQPFGPGRDPSARARIAGNAGCVGPEDRMKCPSSSASAARNSARISSSVIISRHRRFRLRRNRPSTFALVSMADQRRLRVPKPAPIEAAKSRGAASRVSVPTH